MSKENTDHVHIFCRHCLRKCKQSGQTAMANCYLYNAKDKKYADLIAKNSSYKDSVLVAQISTKSGEVTFKEICYGLGNGESWAGEVWVNMEELTKLSDYAQNRIYKHMRGVLGRHELSVDYNDIKTQVYYFIWHLCKTKAEIIIEISDNHLVKYFKGCVKRACQQNGMLMKSTLEAAGYALKPTGEIAEVPTESSDLDAMQEDDWDKERYVSDHGVMHGAGYGYCGVGYGRRYGGKIAKYVTEKESWETLEKDEDLSILVLRFKEDLTFEKIAEQIGVSTTTAKNRVDKAIGILRKKALKIPGGVFALSEILPKIIDEGKVDEDGGTNGNNRST